MYDVISLSVSCRRGISDLNCSECTTSFACGAMYEVSHESSQITVLNGPCLFACVLSLKCVWGLRLEFYFSNCLFIHLCESHFYYCLLIMHHQFVLCAQRRFVYSILSVICYWLQLGLKFLSWPAGGQGSFVGWMPTPPLLILGLWLGFVGAFSYQVFWMHHIFFMWYSVWSGTWDCKIPPFSKAGIIILTLTVILLIGILYCLHVIIFVNGLFVFLLDSPLMLLSP